MLSEYITLSENSEPGFDVYSSRLSPPDPEWRRRYILKAGANINDLRELIRTGDALCLDMIKVGSGALRFPDLLLFDVDGVGCAYPNGGGHAKEFTQICALQLRRIWEETRGRVMVVIISRRRNTPEMFDELKKMMIDGGVPFQIAGCIPDFSERQDVPSYSRRAHEVQAFLQQWQGFYNTVAGVDDEIFGYEDVPELPKFFHPDPATGITEKIADDIIYHFQSAPR